MDELKSKSQKKRDADALQTVGVQLIALPLEKLDQLPLSDELKRAILEAKTLKSHGAIRRQAQLIGKRMRSADFGSILAEYDKMLAEDRSQTATFHTVEQWRDRLIHEGHDALTEFVTAYRPEDLQQLRQLIKKAVNEQTNDRHAGARKALFRYLREYV